MINIYYSGGRFIVSDPAGVDAATRGYFGRKREGGTVELMPEEALYLIDVRNAECRSERGLVSFNEMASGFLKAKKFAARYFTYKDWRDRGLVIVEPKDGARGSARQQKEYPMTPLKMPRFSVAGIFFKSDLITIVDDSKAGKALYDDFWFGQYGSYKAADRGRLNKLDAYETVFLCRRKILKLKNTSVGGVIMAAASRRKDFSKLYGVYADWRERGYVIKTGFKFGTHFRVYFSGARPFGGGAEGKDWIHSKHVIHVFPKNSKLLISEWARVIRVAHSVRKTFILAVPGRTKPATASIDYLLYHRQGSDADNPKKDRPKFAMLSLSEEEYIGGNEFANAIKAADDAGLDLVLAIADRETSVTYYRVRQIKLKGSPNEYYEIDWMQP